ncbi:MAG: DUF2244 domain-containing protein [Burkholderiales bacterium]
MLRAERAVMENPRREMVFIAAAPGFSVLLKRNCSISPAALARVFAFLVAVTLGIGIGFAAVGAWLVLPFAGIEVALLAVAFLANGRHAADYERIERAGERLTVEVSDAGRTEHHEMDVRATQVRMGHEGRAARVLLSANGRHLELGRHLHEQARVQLAAELAKRMRHRTGKG